MAGDIKWSGYKAASGNVLTTELNSLADGAVSALSAEVDNTTNLYLLADLQLDLASVTISSTTAFAEIYIVPTVDGTNYPSTDTTYANYMSQYLAGTMQIKAVSAATFRGAARGILVPPGKFKVALRNRAGAAFAAASNTLAARYYNEAYT